MSLQNILKHSFCLVLVLALCATTYASTPVYDVEFDFNTVLREGSYDIGDILFTKREYQTEEIILLQSQDKVMQQYDTLIWNSVNTIRLIYPDQSTTELLSQGENIKLSIVGDYVLQNISNSSIESVITVTQADPIDLTLESKGGMISFTHDTDFTLSDTVTQVPVRVTVEEGIQASSYEEEFVIESDFDSRTMDITLQMSADYNWSVVRNNLSESVNVQSGYFQELGIMTFENEGNENSDLRISVTGNASNFMVYQNNPTVFRGSRYDVFFGAQIPSKTANDKYVARILVEGNGKSYTDNISIFIKDTSNPVIDNVTYTKSSVYRPITVDVIAKDNIGLRKAIVYYLNESTELDVDEPYVSGDFIVKNDTYLVNVSVCVFDISSNKKCEADIIRLEKMDDIIKNSITKIPSKKINMYSSLTMFEITDKLPEDIIISVKDFSHQGKLEDSLDVFDMRILHNDEVISFDSLDDNITLRDAGNVSFEIRSENTGEYEILFDVIVPGYMEKINQVKLTGKFVEYDIPEDYERDWYDGKLVCVVHDSGDFDSSYRECTVQFPLSYDVDELVIPMTVEQRDLSEQSHNNTIQLYEQQQFAYNATIMILIGFGIVILFAAYYYVFLQPTYYRFLLNLKK